MRMIPSRRLRRGVRSSDNERAAKNKSRLNTRASITLRLTSPQNTALRFNLAMRKTRR